MTRIIAGTYGGRRLAVPPAGTRPTSDRAREGLFSSLASFVELEGLAVLDLYAGSGALGLEALSRGAATATLVERDARASAVLRANVASLRLPAGAAVLVEGDALSFLSRDRGCYDVVLLDPPYELDVAPVLAAVGPRLASAAVVVVERRTRDGAPVVPDPLVLQRSRRYGEATLWYFRAP